MSMEAMRWVLTNSTVTASSERHVLTLIAYHLNSATREAYPSTALLSTESGLSLATVKRAVASLLRSHALMRREGDRRVGRFTVTTYRIPDFSDPPELMVSPGPELTVSPGPELKVSPGPELTDARTGARGDSHQGSLTHAPGLTVTPGIKEEPQVEPQLEPQARVARAGGETSRDLDAFVSIWSATMLGVGYVRSVVDRGVTDVRAELAQHADADPADLSEAVAQMARQGRSKPLRIDLANVQARRLAPKPTQHSRPETPRPSNLNGAANEAVELRCTLDALRDPWPVPSVALSKLYGQGIVDAEGEVLTDNELITDRDREAIREVARATSRGAVAETGRVDVESIRDILGGRL